MCPTCTRLMALRTQGQSLRARAVALDPRVFVIESCSKSFSDGQRRPDEQFRPAATTTTAGLSVTKTRARPTITPPLRPHSRQHHKTPSVPTPACDFDTTTSPWRSRETEIPETFRVCRTTSLACCCTTYPKRQEATAMHVPGGQQLLGLRPGKDLCVRR